MKENFDTQDVFNIEAVRIGNSKAFEEIYRFYFPKLCYYVYSFVHDQDVSKDIVHDVFSAVWTNRNELPEILSLKLYLYRAAKNKTFNFLKHEKHITVRSENLELMNFRSAQNIERELEKNELGRLVEKSINKLSPKCREVFILVKFHGMKYNEVAELLKISANTVQNHVAKAFNQLRKDISRIL